MNIYADKTQENKSRSAANKVSQTQIGSEGTSRFVDNRPEVIAQKEQQALANNKPQVRQLRALQETANNSPKVRQTAQLQSMTDNRSVLQKSATEEQGSIPVDPVQFRDESLNAGASGTPVVQMQPINIGGVQQNAFAWATTIVPRGLRGEFADWLTTRGNAFAAATPAAAGQAFINSMHPADVFEAVCDAVLAQGMNPVIAPKRGARGNLAYVTLYWAVNTPALAGIGLNFHVDRRGTLTAGGAWLTGYPGGANNHATDLDLDQQALEALARGSDAFETARQYEIAKHEASLKKFASMHVSKK